MCMCQRMARPQAGVSPINGCVSTVEQERTAQWIRVLCVWSAVGMRASHGRLGLRGSSA